MIRLLAFVLGVCSHEKQSLPFMDHQVCLDCGQTRSYVIGYRPGKWHRATPDEPYRHQTVPVEQHRKEVSEGWR